LPPPVRRFQRAIRELVSESGVIRRREKWRQRRKPCDAAVEIAPDRGACDSSSFFITRAARPTAFQFTPSSPRKRLGSFNDFVLLRFLQAVRFVSLVAADVSIAGPFERHEMFSIHRQSIRIP